MVVEESAIEALENYAAHVIILYVPTHSKLICLSSSDI